MAGEPLNRTAIQRAVEQAYATGCRAVGESKVATYIPELAKASPHWFGIAVHPLGEAAPVIAGDAELAFTLQSVSKVFSLATVLARNGDSALDGIGVEPSGDAFHSIVRLEEEKGRPRNPLINAGAIAVSERLDGNSVESKIAELRAFLARICPSSTFAIDEAVFHSEWRTGFRNRALANYMRHYGVINDPILAVETYIRQCAITATAASLARLGLFLANGGIDPSSGAKVLSTTHTRTVLALMMTCGLYDEVGHFAVRVGLPAKSGVSGGMLAIAPGRLTVATYGPALGAKGNSVAGAAAIESLAQTLGLSIFDPVTVA
jgi:glutaminase